MDRERCQNCRYWIDGFALEAKIPRPVPPNTEATGHYDCRRRSPLSGKAYNAMWPRTYHTDWCGDWEKLDNRIDPNVVYPGKDPDFVFPEEEV